MFFTDLRGVRTHQRRDIARLEPEFDLSFGIGMISGCMDKIVHALADHLSRFIPDRNHGTQGPNTSGVFLARNMRIGWADNLAYFLYHVWTSIDNPDDSAFPGVIRVVGMAHDIIEECSKKWLALVFRIVLFGKHSVNLHDFSSGESGPGMEFR